MYRELFAARLPLQNDTLSYFVPIPIIIDHNPIAPSLSLFPPGKPKLMFTYFLDKLQ